MFNQLEELQIPGWELEDSLCTVPGASEEGFSRFTLTWRRKDWKQPGFFDQYRFPPQSHNLELVQTCYIDRSTIPNTKTTLKPTTIINSYFCFVTSTSNYQPVIYLNRKAAYFCATAARYCDTFHFEGSNTSNIYIFKQISIKSILTVLKTCDQSIRDTLS